MSRMPERIVNQGVIRRATAQDAATLARLGADTFSETFGHLYPPEDLAAFLADSYSVQRIGQQLADPANALWLMEADGTAVGYALAGACALPHPEVTGACGELKRLYLRSAWQGGGRGSRLLATALHWLEAERRGDLWIGVWSLNLRAQKLYARLGFEKVGEYKFKVGRTLDHEFILRRRRAAGR
jgi:GNAT superfamily N-acetyltransferase